MASASSALINNNSSQALTINTDLLGTASGTKTLTLGGTGAGLSTFAGKISNGTITTLNITKANSGTWVLSGANTYNGPTTIAASGGTLSLSSIDVVANPNPLGQSPAAAANLLLGNGTTLKFTGSAASTDRAFTINGTAANHSATLDASGTGAINFTSTNSPAYGTAAQTRTLILTGTNTGANTLAASIGNNTTAAVSLIKNGVGNWVLSGSNTYSGSTTINAGKLTLGGAGTIASTPVITVNSNATFDVTGPGFTLGAAQTLLGNGTILGSVTSDGTLVPGSSIGTLTFSNNLVLNAGSTNTFEVDGSSPANDAIVLGATVTYGGVLNIVPTGTFTNGQTFTLFSGTGATNPGQFGSLVVNPPVIDTSFTFTNGVLKAVVTPSGPTLTSVSPDPVVGSSFPVTLSLTGSGFTGATDVLLTNLTAATGASYVPNVISDTSITVSFVPGTAAASWDATVVNVAPSAQVPFTVTVPTAVSIDAGNLTSAGPGNVVLSGTGGTPGYSYAVLSATNLAPPVVWSPVVTNAFDGGGNFSYTNAVSPGTPVLFLRLEQ
jgi:fibronectin-binding autotransporter adhesin